MCWHLNKSSLTLRGAKHLHLPAMCTRAVLKISKDTDFVPCQYHFSPSAQFYRPSILTLHQINIKNTPTTLDRDLKNPLFTKCKADACFVLQTSSHLTSNLCISHEEIILTSVLSWKMTFAWIGDKKGHWKSSGSRVDHAISSLAGASVSLNVRETPTEKQ